MLGRRNMALQGAPRRRKIRAIKLPRATILKTFVTSSLRRPRVPDLRRPRFFRRTHPSLPACRISKQPPTRSHELPNLEDRAPRAPESPSRGPHAPSSEDHSRKTTMGRRQGRSRKIMAPFTAAPWICGGRGQRVHQGSRAPRPGAILAVLLLESVAFRAADIQ